MDIRALPVSQGLSWFKQAIDLGARNPRAVFGAAGLLIITLYAAMFVFALGMAVVVGPSRSGDAMPDMKLVGGLVLLLMLLIMVLVPILLGGLMHVIREAEAGRPVRARDVFAPLRGGHGRRLAMLGLLQLGFTVVGGVLVGLLAGGDYWRDYMQAMQAAMHGQIPVVPQPDNAGLMSLVQLVFNYFSFAVMLFAIPLMLFSGRDFVEAVQGGLRASIRNVGANLLAGVLFVAALVAGTLLMVLLATLLGMLGSFLHPVVGGMLSMLLMFGFASVVLVLLTGASFLAWRDTFGDAEKPTPRDDLIEL